MVSRQSQGTYINPGMRRPWPDRYVLLWFLSLLSLLVAAAAFVFFETEWVAREVRTLDASDASNLALAVFAAIALIVGVHQVHISREVSALTAYESYHLACLQYPDLACANVGWKRCGEVRREHYCTFVLFALMTGERVIKLFPRDPTWIHAVKDDIRIHRDFIASDGFKSFRENQNWRVCRLIEEVLEEGPSRPE